MASRSTTQIALLATAAAVTGVVGYAVYFDYQRRHNPEFRKGLSESLLAAHVAPRRGCFTSHDFLGTVLMHNCREAA